MSRIKTFLKDKDKKNPATLLYELFHYGWTKKELPKVYIGKRLYRKEIKNYLNFLSSKEIDRITNSKKLHNPVYSHILRNKLFFAYHLRHNDLPAPVMHGYNFEKEFVFGNNSSKIDDKVELFRYLDTYFLEHNLSSLFVKPLDDMGGKGCYLLTRKDLKNQLEKAGDILLNGNAIYQEVIIQHEEVNKIYAKSINSIRFTSFRDKTGKTNILSAMMRFGNNGSVVDNSTSGGFYVKVNLTNGCLEGKGNQAMKHGGNVFTEHPETGTTLHGFKIPYFEESCKLIQQVNDSIPERVVGWDIAISKNGPVLVEGNDNNSWFGVDIAHGGLLNNPLMAEVLKEA